MTDAESRGGPAGGPRWAVWVGVAAAAAVGVSLAVALWLAPTDSGATSGVEASPHPLFDAVGDALGALGQSEDEFLAARDELLAALESRRHELSPSTLSTVETNLGVIDGAIVDLARALERDPDNPRLARLLAAACRKELELLRQATSLPAGSAAVDVHG